MSNMNKQVLVWQQEELLLNISGDITEQDIYRMIESIKPKEDNAWEKLLLAL